MNCRRGYQPVRRIEADAVGKRDAQSRDIRIDGYDLYISRGQCQFYEFQSGGAGVQPTFCRQHRDFPEADIAAGQIVSGTGFSDQSPGLPAQARG